MTQQPHGGVYWTPTYANKGGFIQSVHVRLVMQSAARREATWARICWFWKGRA
jgi:hypothetical protein